MNEVLDLTPEEEAYLTSLLEKYNRPNRRPTAPRRDLPYFLERLERLLAQIESGYVLTTDDYKNDVWARGILEEIREGVPESLGIRLDRALSEFDERFRSLTNEVRNPTLGGAPMQWWWYRVPRVASHRSFHDGWSLGQRGQPG